MPNIGQVKPQLLLENMMQGNFNFQVADGIREDGPLLAVSAVNAKGNPAWFDGEKSYILPGNSVELQAIRALISKVSNKVPLHLKNGVFKMKAWQANSTSSSFPRQGR